MTRRKIVSFSVAAALLALSVSVPGQSTSQPVGLVLSSAPVAARLSSSAPSMYEQLIDPVNGLTKEDLVRYAVLHNGELAAAREMIAEARGKLRQAGLKANPMLEASGTHSLSTPDNNFMIGAELPLELGGRRSARTAVATREIELREAEVADFTRKLAADVGMKYATAIAAARNLKFTEDLLTLTRDSFRLVQARVEHGRTAPLEQNLVSVEVNRAEATRIGLAGRAEISLLELKSSIGMPAAEPLRLRGEFNPNRPPAPQDDALRTALASRADLAAARSGEALAQAQLEQARIEGKVDASIFANYQRMNSGFDVNGFDNTGALVPVQGIFHFATFGVRLTLPVRNKNQGAIEAAAAAAEAARKRRQFLELVVRNEVTAAYVRLDRAREALAVYRDGVRDQAIQNLEVVRQTYVIGQKSVLDYVGEQRRLIDVETGYTDLLKEYLESVIEIERVAGTPAPTA
jgi:outer membrane protein, heavy metal efflux system